MASAQTDAAEEGQQNHRFLYVLGSSGGGGTIG
jgi:hypothetical protein